MSTCTKSACIYAFFKITDNFFTHLWPGVSNHTLDFSLELKNRAWFVGYTLDFTNLHKKKSLEGKSQDLGSHSLSPSKCIIHLEFFCGIIQAFYVKCGRSLHPAETRSCQSPICPSLATTERISCLGIVLHEQ